MFICASTGFLFVYDARTHTIGWRQHLLSFTPIREGGKQFLTTSRETAVVLKTALVVLVDVVLVPYSQTVYFKVYVDKSKVVGKLKNMKFMFYKLFCTFAGFCSAYKALVGSLGLTKLRYLCNGLSYKNS